MFQVVDKVVYGMSGIRILSSIIEFSGALLMLYFGTASKALQVNGTLALVGPFVLITVTMLGLTGVAGEVHPWRMILVVIGVGCILLGARGN